MTGVIDLSAERDKPRRKGKEQPPDEASIYCCDCGCGMWRLHSDGVVECLNCSGLAALKVAEID